MYLKTILKPFNFTLLKADFAAVLAGVVTAVSSFSKDYLGISGGFFTALAVLIVADFVTGLIAANKIKEKLSSKKGLKTLWKTGGYLLFIYVAFTLHKEVQDKSEVFRIVLEYFHIFLIAHVTFWELFSVDENLQKLGIQVYINNHDKNNITNNIDLFIYSLDYGII